MRFCIDFRLPENKTAYSQVSDKFLDLEGCGSGEEMEEWHIGYVLL